MMFWLFTAIIAVAVLIGVCLAALAYTAPRYDDEELRLGEAEWLARHPEIRFRRSEGHD